MNKGVLCGKLHILSALIGPWRNRVVKVFRIIVEDLPPDLRVALERNTGVVIDIVIEETPAFAANILPGDILIEVNGTPVRNKNHFLNEVRNKIRNSNDDNSSVFRIIRNGTEKEIVLH